MMYHLPLGGFYRKVKSPRLVGLRRAPMLSATGGRFSFTSVISTAVLKGGKGTSRYVDLTNALVFVFAEARTRSSDCPARILLNQSLAHS